MIFNWVVGLNDKCSFKLYISIFHYIFTLIVFTIFNNYSMFMLFTLILFNNLAFQKKGDRYGTVYSAYWDILVGMTQFRELY